MPTWGRQREGVKVGLRVLKRWEWGAEICPREEMGAPKLLTGALRDGVS